MGKTGKEYIFSYQKIDEKLFCFKRCSKQVAYEITIILFPGSVLP
jgi:hypothetical protein